MSADYKPLYSTNNAMEKGLPNNGDGNRNSYDCALALGADGAEFILGALDGDADHAFVKFDLAEAIMLRDALSAQIDRVRS